MNAHNCQLDDLRPNGLVGDVFDWILDTAGMPQPKFAAASALTVCGALAGGHVKDRTGQYTNLFTLAVAPSSSGKNDPMRSGIKIVQALERSKILAGEVASDSALEKLLQYHPTRYLALDEVGDYLGSIKSAGQSNPYLRTVVPMFKKVWSSAGSTYVGKARATDRGEGGKWHKENKQQRNTYFYQSQ